ncbi:Hypothetical predicted protein [Lecanosticta acicola]|uniref:RNA recognition motif-containing protein n=1 Tax=Lecanosticta acicola TaxID=111012 RepID=A0AAI9ED20_9PEZI|nr:Hypothetical predicted protein [Lecanosticta acicola]
MPAGPGESLVTTVFGDVHYYFGKPSSVPQHHRFDRGSYVYLFNNAAQRQAKLEIANHAGTAEQDAFDGYLNAATVQYSHLQPTLFTIVVHPAAVQDQSMWHLPGFDERNQQKYMYKLHTIDLYLWTERDANSFLGHLKTILSREQLDIKNAPASSTPHAEHRDSMSPVVQQLEKTAIGSAFPPRAISAVSAHSLPGPPTPASAESLKPVTPLAYNPAAPAAPEPVQYREKTPPPPDDGTGTGLNNAAKYDTVPQQPYAPGSYQNSAQTTPHNAYFSGPPQHRSISSQSSFPGPPGGVPPPPQQQRTPSFGPMAQSTVPQPPPSNQTPFSRESSYGAAQAQTQYANYNPQQQTQYANYPGSPGFNSQLPPTPSAPPAYSAGPLQSPGLPPPPPQQHQHLQQQQQQQQGQQQTPGGGYSNYSYSAAQNAQAGDVNTHGAYTGDMHSQVYRPTEAEATSHHPKPRRTQTGSASTEGKNPKISESFGNLEGKVGKYLTKLDKLW